MTEQRLNRRAVTENFSQVFNGDRVRHDAQLYWRQVRESS
jgi:hypothetical protein